MTKIKKPDLSKAIITIKGYHFSCLAPLGILGILFFSIAMLIIALKASKVFSARAMTISWIVCGVLMGISVTALIGGIVLSIVLKKRDCLAFFKDFIIVYEFNSIFNYGYRSFKYDEIKEYGFIHELEREAKELRMYLKSEVYNHGKMIILDVSGKKHKIPVNDIDKAKEFFKTYTCKDETVYQKLHGIHY